MFRTYIKIQIRILLQNIGYSTINILGLTIGISSCIFILLYIQDELSYDRYPEKSEQIYRIVMDVSAIGQGKLETARTPPAWAPYLSNHFPEIESYVRLKPPIVSWLVEYEALQKKFYETGFFFADETVVDFFSLKVLRGNPEEALRQPSTVVLTESMVQKYFSSEDPIGQVIRVDNTYEFTVMGVIEDIPSNSHFNCNFLASFITLNSLDNAPYGLNYGESLQQDFPDLYTYIRLPMSYDSQEFNHKIRSFIDRYYTNSTNSFNGRMEAYLQPLTSIHLNSHRADEIQVNGDISSIYIYFIIAFSILLIACINFINLVTARTSLRNREIGLRKVLGANRTQLMAQLMGDSIIAAITSVMSALILTQILLPTFNRLLGKAFVLDLSSLSSVIGVICLIILVSIITGSYPAFFLSEIHPVSVLKNTIFHKASPNQTLRKALVGFQIAIFIIFLIGASIISSQIDYMKNKDLGFDNGHIIIMSLGDPNQRIHYTIYKDLLLKDPTILAVSGLSSLPGARIESGVLLPEGISDDEGVIMNFLGVDHDFVATLELEMVSGRFFSRNFKTDNSQALVINETAAKSLGWERQAIGKKISIGQLERIKPEVIGVVRDFHYKSLHTKIEPLVIALRSLPIYLAINISPNDINRALSHLEKKWYEVYPNTPFQYTFLGESFEEMYNSERLRGRVFYIFSGVACFIACLGFVGLTAFTVEQRAKEIGIRKIMGASIPSLYLLMMTGFIKLIIVASFFSSMIAYFIMNIWLKSFAYRTDISPWVFISAIIIALLLTVFTSGYQVIKVTLKKPTDSLHDGFHYST